jgi:hypothetical protein
MNFEPYWHWRIRCLCFVLQYTRSKGFLVSIPVMYMNILSLLQFLNWRKECRKILWKLAKNLTLMDRHKNTRGLSTLGCGQYYPPRSPLYNDKKSSCARMRHPNKIFNSLMTYLILRTSANLGVQKRRESWPTNWPVRILSKNNLESYRIMENIFLTPKIKNLSRKKFYPPFCMKTFHCESIAITKIYNLYVQYTVSWNNL